MVTMIDSKTSAMVSLRLRKNRQFFQHPGIAPSVRAVLAWLIGAYIPACGMKAVPFRVSQISILPVLMSSPCDSCYTVDADYPTRTCAKAWVTPG
jgi:hypothetical protein